MSNPSEPPKESESLPKLSRRRTSKLGEGHHLREKFRTSEGNGTRHRRSLSARARRACRSFSSKVASALTLPAEKATDGGKDTITRKQERRRQHRKKDAEAKVGEGVKVDENVRIIRRVKNLVNRIRLEQNLIDAYSGEGWKGNSREKIRPEKELQRAEMQILRCKLAIRDLIRDLHNLGLDGSLQESAFDDEGRIFHEEIFCAACKSQEAFADNDIILCDGSCDRGFHQGCVDPPLATVDIPPGDEGWLCPVCDLKVECLNYINGYLGTEFQVEDSWETFFATAAAANGCASNSMEEDWPSEDSDDDDYDPQRKGSQDENENEGASDMNVQKVSATDSLTGSDIESELSSEFDAARSNDSQSSGLDRDELRHTDRRPQRGDQGSGMDLKCGNIIVNHYPKIHAPTAQAETEDIAPVSGKRNRKPVDYKRLHKEIYGDELTEDDVLSEDEEWGPGKRTRRREAEGLNGVARRVRKKSGDEQLCVRGKALVGQDNDGVNKQSHGGRVSFCQRLCEERKSRRLPEFAVEMLRGEFDTGTCFPTRAYKEDLAKQLGISSQQVCSWFKNARHADKHGVGQCNPQGLKREKKVDAESNGDLSCREGVDEMEVTNGLLVEKLDEVQVKLCYLKRTLEAIVGKRDTGADCYLMEKSGDAQIFDTNVFVSCSNGKHIRYFPVAEVVEKNIEKACESGQL